MQKIKLVDIDLSHPLKPIKGLEEFDIVRGLLWLHGNPIGYINPKISGGICSVQAITKACLEAHTKTILCQLLINGLKQDTNSISSIKDLSIKTLLQLSPSPASFPSPRLTVIVCVLTEQIDYLQACLNALQNCNYSNLDILIVEYGEQHSQNQSKFATQYPNIRYIVEPQKNLGYARNRAILEAQGDLVAFIDVKACVSKNWAQSICNIFSDNAAVMALTGAITPTSLETEAHQQFDFHQQFWRRPFDRQQYCTIPGKAISREWLNTQQVGSGANMAFRRSVFNRIGYFNPKLESHDSNLSGSDFEFFFRLIKQGYGLTYEPTAIIRYSPHKTEEELVKSTVARSTGLISYFLSAGIASARYRIDFLRVAFWFIWYHAKLCINGDPLNQKLARAQVFGFLRAPWIYFKSRKARFENQIPNYVDSEEGPSLDGKNIHKNHISIEKNKISSARIAVREVDLENIPEFIDDVKDIEKTRILTKCCNQVLGWIEIDNYGFKISSSQIQSAVVEQLWETFIKLDYSQDYGSAWDFAQNQLKQYLISHEQQKDSLRNQTISPKDSSVTIVVATYDRPSDLRECLKSLTTQKVNRSVEIIVIDNHPVSGMTPPVVDEFPTVQLIKEVRQGSAYARNAGIVASQGSIIVTTDDDVIAPEDWVENLLKPFSDPSVMAVTGNILPLELETRAQQLFEEHCGLGCGFEPFEVDGAWFKTSKEAVLGWEFGATANAAFRASVFEDPNVGLMEETLGPGTPAGAGEDPHMFYKILKAGYKLRYHPQAYVWHKHRREMSTLSRQTYNYSKSCVAYHLTTWLRDGDRRALSPLFGDLQKYYYAKLIDVIQGKTNYPLSLMFQEIMGHMAGPLGFYLSHRRVKTQGRSTPYSSAQKTTEHRQASSLSVNSV